MNLLLCYVVRFRNSRAPFFISSSDLRMIHQIAPTPAKRVIFRLEWTNSVEVVVQKDIDDFSNHSHDIVEEMSHLTLHCDGMCGNEEYQSKFLLIPLHLSFIKTSMM